ncbi:MAG: hypothetical protein GY757_40725 [bacterium]|nr:hypothetical protein [bacterium]
MKPQLDINDGEKFDFDHWHRTINSWIDEFRTGENPSRSQWSTHDKLTELRNTTASATFSSKNTGKNGTINLYHLWVNLV